MPETVRMEAPSNLATSRPLLNMPRTNAVCLAILKGVPTSFSFFITVSDASTASTTCRKGRAVVQQSCYGTQLWCSQSLQ